MNVPPNTSAFWPFARFAVVSALLFAMLAFNYNRLDVRDIGTLITVLGGLGMFDSFKAFAAKHPDEKPPTDEA